MLKSKTAIVTGGAQGIGRAICLALAEAGADVVVVDRVASEGQNTRDMIRAIGRQSEYIDTDVSNESSVISMVESAVRRFSHIDILVNDAGIVTKGKQITEARVGPHAGCQPEEPSLLSRVVATCLEKASRKIVTSPRLNLMCFQEPGHYAFRRAGAMLTKRF